uniref:Uncharacterized protein n=1 Tax=Gloeothece verrucosa (strain PCC 7822) TaxID=497965 RepID=E0UAI1_GLOV7|nr:hypothetical protein Cyan7822_0689 [Gloeothece verrucosa PCC 7822]
MRNSLPEPQYTLITPLLDDNGKEIKDEEGKTLKTYSPSLTWDEGISSKGRD